LHLTDIKTSKAGGQAMQSRDNSVETGKGRGEKDRQITIDERGTQSKEVIVEVFKEETQF